MLSSKDSSCVVTVYQCELFVCSVQQGAGGLSEYCKSLQINSLRSLLLIFAVFQVGMLPVNRLSGPGGMTGPETAVPVNRPITQ